MNAKIMAAPLAVVVVVAMASRGCRSDRGLEVGEHMSWINASDICRAIFLMRDVPLDGLMVANKHCVARLKDYIIVSRADSAVIVMARLYYEPLD